MALVIGTLAWLVLVGLLWYMRPPDLVWLFASIVLAIGYFTAFFWYVARRPGAR